MRTHNRKLAFVSLYPDGEMQAMYVGRSQNDVRYRKVPADYDVPEWLQARFAILAMLPVKEHGIPHTETEIGSVLRYVNGFVVHQARVPDEHGELWSELL